MTKVSSIKKYRLSHLLILISLSLIFFHSCSQSNTIEIKLEAQEVAENRGPRWSPKGEKLALNEKNEGLETQLKLGALPNNSWSIRLIKTSESQYYNTLFVDHNQNNQFEEFEKTIIDPTESRGKIWSSFNEVVQLTVNDPWTGKEVKNVYPISFWYVFDPREENPEKVLRFSRRGWMEGTALVEGVEANVLLTESLMDGVIDTNDSWAIAPKSALKELYDYRYNRDISTHAWLNDLAYRIVEVHPSGLQMILEPFDPGLSRVEEAEKLDIYAPDKKAAHSGGLVKFGHDFQQAEERAKKENKKLFIDFETTWCGPCKLMDKIVYTADLVVDASKNIIAVKIDGDEHPELAKRFDVKAYPSLILLSSDGKILNKKVGYQSVKQTAAFLQTKKEPSD